MSTIPIFTIEKEEPWNKYLLEDGIQLKVKIEVAEIRKIVDQLSDENGVYELEYSLTIKAKDVSRAYRAN